MPLRRGNPSDRLRDDAGVRKACDRSGTRDRPGLPGRSPLTSRVGLSEGATPSGGRGLRCAEVPNRPPSQQQSTGGPDGSGADQARYENRFSEIS